jgi:hypothetical protein
MSYILNANNLSSTSESLWGGVRVLNFRVEDPDGSANSTFNLLLSLPFRVIVFRIFEFKKISIVLLLGDSIFKSSSIDLDILSAFKK